ncbi:hypothetical protein [Mycobacterium sp. NPDC050441]|uniref:hypothetical protein n=1 Tax=Mycobacterium sp. NPDC050441 TaxID=3155403 RepID=UPI00340332D8
MTALFAGLCALAVAFFPAGIGFLAIPLGIFGIVAGVLGVQAAGREGRGAGSAITGIVVSVLAMAVAAVMFFGFYRSPTPSPAASTSPSAPKTTTSKKLGPATAIPKYNRDIQSVLTDEVAVSFGPYSDDGGDPNAQHPVAEMTIVSKRDIARFCIFTVRALDSAGAEVYPGLGVQVTLSPGTTARENVFGFSAPSSIPRSKADRLKGGTFEVAKASCS